MKFSKSHEWVSVEGNIATVGITDFAKKELGDIVFIDTPKVNQNIRNGELVCVVESTKAASDIYTPVSGIIQSVNADFLNDPSWIYTIKLSDQKELDLLMTKEEYEKLITG